jgi:hypothetical protein
MQFKFSTGLRVQIDTIISELNQFDCHAYIDVKPASSAAKPYLIGLTQQ